MRVAPENSAAVRSAEIPGAVRGRAPKIRSVAYSVPEEMIDVAGEPVSSTLITSEAARPIQARDSSPVRFSNRSMARRCGPGGGFREQEVARAASPTIRNAVCARWTRSPLQNTRFHGHQFLEFGQLAKRNELGIFHQLLALGESFLEGLADIQQRALIHTGFGVGLSEVIM